MRKLFCPPTVASAAVLLTLCACCIPIKRATHEETRTINVPHVAASSVDVETSNGGISVKVAERDDVLIVARLRMISVERLAATRIVSERDAANRLRIRVAWPDDKRRSNEGCNFDITVPDAQGVKLKSSNGRLMIGGLSGEADLSTSNGGIQVRGHDGDLKARSSNGGLEIEGVTGDITADTSNGRIQVQDAVAEVRARTSNGSVHVQLAEDGAGPVDIETSNGSVTLELGRAFAGDLELRTSNAGLNVSGLEGAEIVSMGKRQARLKFGDFHQSSRVRTSNGSITVRPR